MMQDTKNGFTIIELVMVIIILGIIAGVTLPKFVNFKTRAIDRQEDYVIGALKTAIKNKYLENLSKGSEPDSAWPCRSGLASDNPFTLLEQSPPAAFNNYAVSTNVSDGITWHYFYSANWFIMCPHWTSATHYGRFYIYKLNPAAYTAWQLGDFFIWDDWSHGH